MKKSRLQIITIQEDLICDYCGRQIPAGSFVFVKFNYDEDNIYPYYWCSQCCLDSYEAEEFENELKQGLYETSDDYEDSFFKDYIDPSEKNYIEPLEDEEEI